MTAPNRHQLPKGTECITRREVRSLGNFGVTVQAGCRFTILDPSAMYLDWFCVLAQLHPDRGSDITVQLPWNLASYAEAVDLDHEHPAEGPAHPDWPRQDFVSMGC